jgi:hypothetical protein
VESRRAVDAAGVEQRDRRQAERRGAVGRSSGSDAPSRNENADAAWSSAYGTRRSPQAGGFHARCRSFSLRAPSEWIVVTTAAS